MHVVPVARLEDFRAIKSSNFKDFRDPKPLQPDWGILGSYNLKVLGIHGPKILQVGGF